MAIIDVRVQIGTTPVWGTPFTEAHLNRMMERYGIDRCVASSTLANSADFIRGNAQIKAVAGKGRISGCAVVNTQYPTQSIADMRDYLSLPGFVALMIRSGAPGRPVTLDECSDILNAHRRFAKPVLIEASDRESVLAVDQIARAFTGIKFVVLSMGGSAWRTAVDVAEKTLNLVLEVSGNPNPDKISLAVEKIGGHRMVFGSNLPLAEPGVTIGLVEDAGIPDSEKKMIYESTAKGLFGWARPKAE